MGGGTSGAAVRLMGNWAGRLTGSGSEVTTPVTLSAPAARSGKVWMQLQYPVPPTGAAGVDGSVDALAVGVVPTSAP